jgi:hypothetical protein
MSSNNNIASQIPIFDGSNYGAWSMVMHAFLRSQGLWQLSAGLDVYPTEMGPTEGTQVERTANATTISDWDKRDDMAIGHITLHVSPPIQEQIARLNDSSTV